MPPLAVAEDLDVHDDLTIDQPSQVWAADITYIPMARGFVYLVAVIDCGCRTHSPRTSVSRPWKKRYADGVNTDQDGQFTGVLKQHQIKISMDGKGRWRDNVFIERLWKSVKYEEVYLHAYDTVAAVRTGLTRYFTFYNTRRPHKVLDRRTPDAVYFESLPLARAA